MPSYWDIPRSARYRFGVQFVFPSTQRTTSVLGAYRDEIASAQIATVKEIVVLPERPWWLEQSQLFLYAFGTFTSIYRTIELLSIPLAKQYQERGVLPVIRPVQAFEDTEAPPGIDALRRRFSLSGMHLFTASLDHER
jgi:hypothetical protein